VRYELIFIYNLEEIQSLKNEAPLTQQEVSLTLLETIQHVGRSRDSSVGIATDYGLDDQGGGSSGQKFSLLHIVQTGSGVHSTSYKMGRGLFPGGKAAEA
jgi:hypothetical protein